MTASVQGWPAARRLSITVLLITKNNIAAVIAVYSIFSAITKSGTYHVSLYGASIVMVRAGYTWKFAL